MEQESQQQKYGKVNVNLSRNRQFVVASDEKGQKIIMPVNLVKHALEIPYTKKDATVKTVDEILRDKKKAELAYQEKITASE